MAATYDTSDLRKGVKIMIDGAPYIVVEAQFVKPGKGAAFTRTKMKNLLTGGVIERNIRSGEKMDGANVEEREFTFLYKEPDGTFVFMDKKSYEQINVPSNIVDDAWRLGRHGSPYRAVRRSRRGAQGYPCPVRREWPQDGRTELGDLRSLDRRPGAPANRRVLPPGTVRRPVG